MDDLLHDIFHFDVDTYATLIHLRVQIECHGQRVYSGRIYTIDPFTQSIVLIDDASNRVHIVLRPDIIQLKILDRDPSLASLKDPFQSSTTSPSTHDAGSMSTRLGNLRQFLSSKRIPHQERLDDNQSVTLLIQNGIVQITAPYTSETISGTNEIVLSRLKFLLKQILD